MAASGTKLAPGSQLAVCYWLDWAQLAAQDRAIWRLTVTVRREGRALPDFGRGRGESGRVKGGAPQHAVGSDDGVCVPRRPCARHGVDNKSQGQNEGLIPVCWSRSGPRTSAEFQSCPCGHDARPHQVIAEIAGGLGHLQCLRAAPGYLSGHMVFWRRRQPVVARCPTLAQQLVVLHSVPSHRLHLCVFGF